MSLFDFLKSEKYNGVQWIILGGDTDCDHKWSEIEYALDKVFTNIIEKKRCKKCGAVARREYD